MVVCELWISVCSYAGLGWRHCGGNYSFEANASVGERGFESESQQLSLKSFNAPFVQ